MNKGCFIKGQKPWNINLKGIHLNPDTEFKPGHQPYNFKELGTPRCTAHKRDGTQVYTTISEKCINTSRGKKYKTNKRIPYSRYIYGYQDIPKGYIIYHKDGNKLNNEEWNLIAITRAELLKINRKGV